MNMTKPKISVIINTFNEERNIRNCLETVKWADEIIPLKLKNKLVEVMEKDLADVVYIPFDTYFFGRLIKGTGWGPLQDVHPRFFKKSFVSFSSAVHSFF
jgi:hypothetical protein